MNIKTVSAIREDLYNTIASTAEGEPLFITSKKGNCVLLSESDWNSIQETLFILNNSKIRKDIADGLETPLSECSDKLPW